MNNATVKVEKGQLFGWWKVIVSVPDGRFQPNELIDIPMDREAVLIFDGEHAETWARHAAEQLTFALSSPSQSEGAKEEGSGR